MHLRLTVAIASLLVSLSVLAEPQPDHTAANANTPTLSSKSTLILVPALVRNKAGDLIFTLQQDDFVLTDDGVPQKLHLEQESGGEPLALVVDLEGGGSAVDQLEKYAAIESMLDAVVGNVPHKIAVVAYDSSPVLVQDFTEDNNEATKAIQALAADNNGDKGAATLDSLGFSVDLLRKQPVQYRRAILLVSETLDRGSKLKIGDAVRALSDTNTAIYSIGFGTTRSETMSQVGKLSQSEAGPAHGCFSRDPNDPNVDLSQSAARQSLDCVELLAPPLRIAQAAFVALRDALSKNVPESVAHLTGGEYFKMGSEKSLEKDLQTISNHIPNRYILSFQPQSPHPGFHMITLDVPKYAGLKVYARTGYWIKEQQPTH